MCPYLPLSDPEASNKPKPTFHTRRSLNTVAAFAIPERVFMIDPNSSEQIVSLLRRAADHVAQGIKNLDIHSDLHFLADIAESQD